MHTATAPPARGPAIDGGPRERLDQWPGRIVLRFGAGGTAWELDLPDETVQLAEVRVTVRELGSTRQAEASALMPWPTYVQAREWLRCLPDGYLDLADVEPALPLLREVFRPLILALSD